MAPLRLDMEQISTPRMDQSEIDVFAMQPDMVEFHSTAQKKKTESHVPVRYIM